jgi:hypothetical protein
MEDRGMESKAFEEFVQMRCQEIISEDEGIQSLNNELDLAENNLKKTFSQSQTDAFLLYEKLCHNQQMLIETTVYKQCLSDWRK